MTRKSLENTGISFKLWNNKLSQPRRTANSQVSSHKCVLTIFGRSSSFDFYLHASTFQFSVFCRRKLYLIICSCPPGRHSFDFCPQLTFRELLRNYQTSFRKIYLYCPGNQTTICRALTTRKIWSRLWPKAEINYLRQSFNLSNKQKDPIMLTLSENRKLSENTHLCISIFSKLV